MSGPGEFVELLARIDLTGAQGTRALLLCIAEAWTAAEAATVSENEARRWSPVCAAAAALAESLAVLS